MCNQLFGQRSGQLPTAQVTIRNTAQALSYRRPILAKQAIRLETILGRIPRERKARMQARRVQDCLLGAGAPLAIRPATETPMHSLVTLPLRMSSRRSQWSTAIPEQQIARNHVPRMFWRSYPDDRGSRASHQAPQGTMRSREDPPAARRLAKESQPDCKFTFRYRKWLRVLPAGLLWTGTPQRSQADRLLKSLCNNLRARASGTAQLPLAWPRQTRQVFVRTARELRFKVNSLHSTDLASMLLLPGY